MDHPGGELFTIPYPPHGWFLVKPWSNGHSFINKNGLRLLIDCQVEEDGRKWLHVSVSRANCNPSHDEMCQVKQDFIGERYAYAVYPPPDKYVNVHPHCLHLWALAEGAGQVLPEFSGILEGIGRSI